MRGRRAAVPAALALLAGLLVGCSTDDLPKPPGEAQIDVNTPKLARLKQQAGVGPCVPGDGTAGEGGLPELTLPCLGGGDEVDLSTLQGPMILNLWQAFCGPCIKEMPALQAFSEQYGAQVPVLGIDYSDTQPEAALKLARKTGVTYPLLADPGGDLNRRDGFPPILGVPYLVFLDADGEVTALPGGVESVDELVDLADEHLGVSL